MPAEPTTSPDKKGEVLARLESPIKNRDDLLRLFVSTLGYQRTERPIPVTKETFGDGIALDLAQKFRPIRLAEAGSFNIIYTELEGDRLDYWRQRVLATKLLETFQDSLFVFARAATINDKHGAEIHLVNVKNADRRVFRRFKLGPGERYRTTAERLTLLDISEAADLSPLALRSRQDAAFDVESVTKKFFQDFCKVFEDVAKDIRDRNKSLAADTVERETQTLLDRLLFLYFIQRKGWLNRQRDYLYAHFKPRLADAPDGTTYWERFLRPVFVKLSTEGGQADIPGHDLPFLNGGLFADEYGAEQREESQRRRASLKIGNRVFQRVFEDLLEVYNFTVREDTPLNQDVAIDPEMLGKIFESLVLQLEQSDTSGKTSRHDTGSHYTPRSIVHYLCQGGLRAWLEQSPPAPSRAQDWPERLGKLLAIDASDGIDPDEQALLESCLTVDEARILLKRLDDLRACDPAVGSGAFPVGLLLELVNLARLCETRVRGKDPVSQDCEWLFNAKSRFIQRVIYGVDIQERAVEICKLRLWLSLIVDHPLDVDVDKCSVKDFRRALKNLPALPNLDFKIRVTNSLIDRIHGEPVNLTSIAAEDKTLPPILNRLTSAKLQFYEAHSITDKRRLRFDILDATAELSMLELARSKLSFGLFVSDSDIAGMKRLAEIDRAMKQMGAMREQIAAARHLKTTEQDQALERLHERFNDPRKPTFVWQLDFAEVFHRFAGARNVDLAPDDSKAAEQLPAKTGVSQSGGFDLVVTNPPYVRQELLTQYKDYLQARYEAFNGTADLYVFFIEAGVRMLCAGGVLSIIVSNSWLRASYGEELRRYLKGHSAVLRIVDFGGLPVFENAKDTYVCLPLIAKGVQQGRVEVCNVPSLGIQDLSAYVAANHFTIPHQRLADKAWSLKSDAAAAVFEKIVRAGQPLGLYVNSKMFYGIKTGLNEAFEIGTEERSAMLAKTPGSSVLIRPFVGGLDIRRYFIENRQRFLIAIPCGWTRNGMAHEHPAGRAITERQAFEWFCREHPAVAKHLQAFTASLKKRQDQGDYWWELRPCDYYAYLDTPKIVFPDICKAPRFALDRSGIYLANTAYCLGSDSLYLLGILNSRLFWFAISNISIPFGVRAGEYRYRLIYQYMEKVPIRPIDLTSPSERSAHDGLVDLVQRILSAKQAALKADTTALEREIDERVYRLYGLTAEEIKIVEEGHKA